MHAIPRILNATALVVLSARTILPSGAKRNAFAGVGVAAVCNAVFFNDTVRGGIIVGRWGFPLSAAGFLAWVCAGGRPRDAA